MLNALRLIAAMVGPGRQIVAELRRRTPIETAIERTSADFPRLRLGGGDPVGESLRRWLAAEDTRALIRRLMAGEPVEAGDAEAFARHAAVPGLTGEAADAIGRSFFLHLRDAWIEEEGDKALDVIVRHGFDDLRHDIAEVVRVLRGRAAAEPAPGADDGEAEDDAGPTLDDLLEEIRTLPAPWSGFDLSRPFHAVIETQQDYDIHGTVREAIYAAYPDEGSISHGSLPPILSPMFWEVARGLPRTRVFSVRRPGTPIPLERYRRYRRLYRYTRRTPKVVVVDPRKYVASLRRSHEGLDASQRREDLERRFRAIDEFTIRIDAGEWPQLLLMVPEGEAYASPAESYTISPHMHVQLLRGDPPHDHKGDFRYEPFTNGFIDESYRRASRRAIELVSTRSDWPPEVTSLDQVLADPAFCRGFNIRSLRLQREWLERLPR